MTKTEQMPTTCTSPSILRLLGQLAQTMFIGMLVGVIVAFIVGLFWAHFAASHNLVASLFVSFLFGFSFCFVDPRLGIAIFAAAFVFLTMVSGLFLCLTWAVLSTCLTWGILIGAGIGLLFGVWKWLSNT